MDTPTATVGQLASINWAAARRAERIERAALAALPALGLARGADVLDTGSDTEHAARAAVAAFLAVEIGEALVDEVDKRLGEIQAQERGYSYAAVRAAELAGGSR